MTRKKHQPTAACMRQQLALAADEIIRPGGGGFSGCGFWLNELLSVT